MQSTFRGREWEFPWEKLNSLQWRPLPLKLDTSSKGRSFVLSANLRFLLEELGLEETLYIDWTIDATSNSDDVPILIAIPITVQERRKARHPRKLTWYPRRGVEVRVPTRLLDGEGTAEVGLEMDLDAYTNANRLLFQPLPMEEFFGLLPIRYEQGVEYSHNISGPPQAKSQNQ